MYYSPAQSDLGGVGVAGAGHHCPDSGMEELLASVPAPAGVGFRSLLCPSRWRIEAYPVRVSAGLVRKVRDESKSMQRLCSDFAKNAGFA